MLLAQDPFHERGACGAPGEQHRDQLDARRGLGQEPGGAARVVADQRVELGVGDEHVRVGARDVLAGRLERLLGQPGLGEQVGLGHEPLRIAAQLLPPARRGVRELRPEVPVDELVEHLPTEVGIPAGPPDDGPVGAQHGDVERAAAEVVHGHRARHAVLARRSHRLRLRHHLHLDARHPARTAPAPQRARRRR